MTFAPRSLLFVPGDRPDRFEKALASAADAICIDLEDAVAPESKAQARDQTLAFLKASPSRGRIVVRLNPMGTAAGLADLAALVAGDVAAAALMLPKSESADVLAMIGSVFADAGRAQPLIPLVETALALRTAASLASAPQVTGLALGPVDLAAQMGAVLDEASSLHIRMQIQLAASEAGVMSWDGPSLVIDDPERLAAQTQTVVQLGYTGKLCIHPGQAKPVNDCFTPSPDAVVAAERVLAAAEQAGGGVFRLGGKMIDAPVLASARKVLARAGR